LIGIWYLYPTPDFRGVWYAIRKKQFALWLPREQNPRLSFASGLFPTAEAGKNVQTGFFLVLCGLSQAFYRELLPATILIMRGKGKNIKKYLYFLFVL
jgi:hypothetical protein